MEMLPISSWNGTLHRIFDSVFQILNFDSNQADHFSWKGQSYLLKSVSLVEEKRLKERTKYKLSVEHILMDSLTNTTSAIEEKCTYRDLDTSVWMCKNNQTVIPLGKVCNGQYDCSKNESDVSDENHELCYIKPSFVYLIIVFAFVLMGILMFCAMEVYQKVTQTSKKVIEIDILNHDERMSLTRRIMGICIEKNEETLVSENDMIEDNNASNMYPPCTDIYERKEFFRILIALYFYRPFQNAIENLIDEIIRLESSRHLHQTREYIKCIRFGSGSDSYIPCLIKDVMERNDFWSRKKRFVVDCLHIENAAANMGFQVTLKVAISLMRITFFYYDLLKDAVILESLFHIEDKILADKDSIDRYKSVGGIDFKILAIYLVAIFIFSETAIYIYMYKRRSQYPHMFGRCASQSFYKIVINFFPIHFTLLQTCKMEMKSAYLEYRMSKMMCHITKETNITDNTIRSILEIADEIEEVANYQYNLSTLESEIQIIETAFEREPQMIIQASLFILLNQFSRIQLLFDSFFGLPLNAIMITSWLITGVSMAKSIKSYRDRKRHPNNSGFAGTIMHLISILLLLLPKLALISTTLLNLVYLHPILYITNVFVIIMMDRGLFGNNITSFDAIVSAVCPAYYKIPENEENKENVSKRPKNQKCIKRFGNSFITVIHHATTFVIYFFMGYILRRTFFLFTIHPEKITDDEIQGAQFLEGVALQQEMFTDYWLFIIATFSACYVVHVIFVQIYYLKGHPWKIAIERKC